MRILVTNDDGIESAGIRRLAAMASSLGEVWVVAPESQCSAMSQRITVRKNIHADERDFPVPGVRAFSVNGTPADSVRMGILYLMKENRPDYVFSGINDGYNAGYEIAYSGTVGAAMEGLLRGVPAIAFSNENADRNEVTDHYLKSVTEKILENNPLFDRIWNVNFPGCSLSDCQGVLWYRRPGRAQFYFDNYVETEESGRTEYALWGIPRTEDPFSDSSDISALLNKCVSVGTIRNNVLI